MELFCCRLRLVHEPVMLKIDDAGQKSKDNQRPARASGIHDRI
jgi:hypothetical protein